MALTGVRTRGRDRLGAGGYSIQVEGLAALQRALRRTGTGTDRLVKTRLRQLANRVRDRARASVEHKTGRSGDQPPLAGSLKTSVTQKGASVYSDALHAGVQERGGRVGHGAVIPRASASAYMTKALAKSQADTEKELLAIGSSIEREFARGK